MMEAKQAGADPRSVKLGTFAGVFTPSILTILGIILFLRLGYVIGNTGLGRALVILLLANAISIMTTFSLSAIATNLKVKGGGDYYLISRTLGLEFGGAIGIVLYLAQSVSIAFYCIGFAEVTAAVLPWQAAFLPRLIAAGAVAFLFIFAWLGADWATRFQYVVMAVLAAALVSFFWGGFGRWETSLLSANWSAPEKALPFWGVFAIFFPAVTGFTQGVSMSGDLEDAGRSLPRGTFLAVGVSIAVYFASAVVLAATRPAESLMNDYSAMGQVAAVEFLVTAGVVAATLSSAMASFLGAPRILQSLAADRIFPFLLPFAKGHGAAANPRRGVLLSAAIAFTTIGLGKLNLIAPVVSMFFLISYGLLNYATFFEARTGSLSFRPRFRFYDYRISLAGALACLGVMLAIDLAAGLVALSILMAVYQYLKRTAGPARWADSKRSYHLQRIRQHLIAASRESAHHRYWRPQILLFSDDPRRRKTLLEFAAWCEGDFGLTTVVRILKGQGLKMLKQRSKAEEELRRDIREADLEAWPLVVVAQNPAQGIQTLVQSYGIGPLQANTILLNWLEQEPGDIPGISEILYGRRLKTAFRLGCNIVVLNTDDDGWADLAEKEAAKRSIDVWWWNDASSRLMLLLAYIVTRHPDWQEARIRVLAPEIEKRPADALADLRQLLEDVRIQAEPEIMGMSSADILAKQSSGADLVFIPFRLSGDRPQDPFGNPPDLLLNRLPHVALVLAAEDIDLDAEPEEGEAGEAAAVLDKAADAEKHARRAEKDAEAAREEAEAVREELRRLEEKGEDREASDPSAIGAQRTAAEEAEHKAEKAFRRAAKARAKAEQAAAEAEALGIEVPGAEDGTAVRGDGDGTP
jgi:amino acid transporter